MREEEAVVTIIAIGCGAMLLFALVNRLAAIAKTWMETSLKRDMVARGYTANEIIAVVQSERGPGSEIDMSNVPPAKPVRQPAASY